MKFLIPIRVIFSIVGLLALNRGFSQTAFTQNDSIKKPSKEITLPLISASYAYQWPGGDLKTRFYSNSNIGISFCVIDKKKWMYGLSYGFIFRDIVKEDNVLDNLKTAQGYVLDGNGQFANIVLLERGFSATADIGRVFHPRYEKHPKSGFFAQIGLGYLQHKIKVFEQNPSTPQIQGDYVKGYDRLSSGFLCKEFIGYQHLSANRWLNYFAGIELYQGFTKNRRDYNFSEMRKDDKNRVDLLHGFRAGFSIALYKKEPKAYYFY